MPDSPDNHHDALTRWIESATRDLTRAAAARLAEEFHDHYAEAYDAAIAEGRSESEAHAAAMNHLGDPSSTHIAAIPVHGDPHRLKFKAALVAVGFILTVFALGYARNLKSQAVAHIYYHDDLARAVTYGNIEHVREILDTGLEPTGELLGPQMWRTLDQDEIVDTFRILLEHGADPNYRTNHDETSLLYELTNSNGTTHPKLTDEMRGELVDLFVKHGINTNPGVPEGPDMNLLSSAAYHGDTYMVDKFRELGMQDRPDVLIYEGRTDELIAWAERDPSILTEKHYIGATLLHLTAERGSIDTLKRMIDLGASIDATNAIGDTVLHYAFNYWIPDRSLVPTAHEMRAYLIELGCDPNHKNKLGYTPFHYAVLGYEAPEVTMLLYAGADVNALTETKIPRTPLLMAVNKGTYHERREDVAVMLIEAGANINIRGQHDRTPLHLAAECNMSQVIRELVERGASLTARDAYLEEHMQDYIVHHFTPEDFGNMPIHLAAIDGGRVKERHGDPTIEHTDALETLIDLGSDINAIGGGGRTPLQLACEYNNYKSVRLLLQRGADPTIPDDEGKTALHTEDPQLVELFAEFGHEAIRPRRLRDDRLNMASCPAINDYPHEGARHV